MLLDVRRQGIDIDETSHDRLARRVEFALGRLGQHVSRVSVHLADGHKHHGISDKRCRILVRLQNLPEDHLSDRRLQRGGHDSLRDLQREIGGRQRFQSAAESPDRRTARGDEMDGLRVFHIRDLRNMRAASRVALR